MNWSRFWKRREEPRVNAPDGGIVNTIATGDGCCQLARLFRNCPNQIKNFSNLPLVPADNADQIITGCYYSVGSFWKIEGISQLQKRMESLDG